MSAIFGILEPGGRPAERARLQRMGETMPHRGPDGTALWTGGSFGVGHLALHATPEARYEVQPFPNGEDGVLVADLRLDNRNELIAELALESRPDGRAPSDIEILAAAWHAWGEACLDRILGAFAFVVWDGNRRRLFAARDHMGVKPFNYAWRHDGFFAFATEVKGLLALPEVSKQVDEQALAHHLLVPVAEDPAETFYRDIRTLPAGHSLWIEDGRLRTGRYWGPDPDREHPPASDEEFAEEFRRLFFLAVDARLRTTGPVASMLSGGLDSSSIVSTAATLLSGSGRAPLHTLSSVYGDLASDERPFIQSVIDAFDVVPHFMRGDEISPLVDSDVVVPLLDRPNPAANLHLSWTLDAEAARAGCRVVLEGFDGDSTVSHGVFWFGELASHGRLLRLAREIRRWGRRQGRPWRGELRQLVQRRYLRPRLESWGVYPLYRRLRGITPWTPPPLPQDPDWTWILAPEYLARLGELPRLALRDETTEREYHCRVLTQPLMARTTELLDLTGAARGVEPRFPYMDKRVVEFCVALPARQKIHDGWTRRITREALRGVLPEPIRTRLSKADLGHGFLHALRGNEAERLQRIVNGMPGGLDRFVRADFMSRTHERFMNGTASERELVLFWKALCAALWLESSTSG